VLSGKLGLVTGQDLADAVGKQYPKHARILLWALLEISVIAADIQETIGCALAVNLLSNDSIPLWAGCIIVSVAAFGLLQVRQKSVEELLGVKK
jgi:NRAMP (natural resistance-associated macrophage protein)-like metal ion transporter